MSYAVTGYSTFSYSGGPSFAVLYIMGASLAAPVGSNLLAPMPVGRYGAFSNSLSVFKTTSKQFPVRMGMGFGFVSLVSLQRAAIGGLGTTFAPLPAYGN